MNDPVPLFRSVGFEPEAVKVLADAYEAAVGLISETVAVENPRDFIARRIVRLAQQGERNAARLRDRALRDLARESREVEIYRRRMDLQKAFASAIEVSIQVQASQTLISESMSLIDRVDRQLQQHRQFPADADRISPSGA